MAGVCNTIPPERSESNIAPVRTRPINIYDNRKATLYLASNVLISSLPRSWWSHCHFHGEAVLVHHFMQKWIIISTGLFNECITLSPEDGDSMFLRNVDIYLRVYTTSQPRRTTTDILLTAYANQPWSVVHFRHLSHLIWPKILQYLQTTVFVVSANRPWPLSFTDIPFHYS
jgi:hypothetical protein